MVVVVEVAAQVVTQRQLALAPLLLLLLPRQLLDCGGSHYLLIYNCSKLSVGMATGWLSRSSLTPLENRGEFGLA